MNLYIQSLFLLSKQTLSGSIILAGRVNRVIVDTPALSSDAFNIGLWLLREARMAWSPLDQSKGERPEN